jgi:hypothetical protein
MSASRRRRRATSLDRVRRDSQQRTGAWAGSGAPRRLLAELGITELSPVLLVVGGAARAAGKRQRQLARQLERAASARLPT